MIVCQGSKLPLTAAQTTQSIYVVVNPIGIVNSLTSMCLHSVAIVVINEIIDTLFCCRMKR